MRKFWMALGMGALLNLNLFAAPALKKARTIVQSDGTTLVVFNTGDEYFHYFTTADGIVVARGTQGDFCYADLAADGSVVPTETVAHEAAQRSEAEVSKIRQLQLSTSSIKLESQTAKVRSRVAAAQSGAPLSSIGTPNVPVLLVQFSDSKFTHATYGGNPQSFFNKHFNAENYTAEGGVGSVRSYFVDQSSGKFKPNFVVIGPITLDHNAAYYGTSENVTQMFRDAIAKAIASGTDFSSCKDASGKVGIVGAIYAGLGESTDGGSETIWPKQTSLGYTTGGITFTACVCTNELVTYVKGTPTVDGIGTFCHEFSHGLGLPDFYNTNSATDIFGLSSWSLMDYGFYWKNGLSPIGYTAYERSYMGWLTPMVLSAAQDVTLQPLATSQTACKIVNNSNANEYYLLENRQASTWFPSAMGTGMLVFHVDYNASAWNANTLNNDKNHQRMTIIPADNSLVKENAAGVTANDYKGDFYPGITNNTSLTDTSTPAATLFTGGKMGKPITEIKVNADKSISFKFMGGSTDITDKIVDVSSVVKTGYKYTNATQLIKAITNGEKVQVFTLDGTQIVPSTVSSLVKGIYVVRESDGTTYKVAIP